MSRRPENAGTGARGLESSLLVKVVLPCILLLGMLLRLALTAYHKSATYDESLYMTYGYSVLETGDYRLSIDKPPLAPILSALPLRLLHLKFDLNDEDWRKAGDWIHSSQPWQDMGAHRWNFDLRFLFRNNVPAARILHAARLGVILGVTIIALCAFLCARGLFGNFAALCWLFFFSFSPNILAHASLCTEDALVASLFFLAVLCFIRWIDDPQPKPGIFLGLSTGLALMAKNSALLLGPIFALLLVVALVAQRARLDGQFMRRLAISLAISLAVAGLVVLVFYRFSQVAFYFYNIKNTLLYQARGQATFCWEQYSFNGFWFYYLVCLLFKTPLPLLLLVAWFLWARKDSLRTGPARMAALIAPVLLFVLAGSANRIQIGLRYILPVYPFLFGLAALLVAAQFPADKKITWSFGRIGVAALCVWFFVSSIGVHPDYLAYFNELAGGPANGYKYLVDSNIDWGQDLDGLNDYVAHNPTSDVILSYYGAAVPEAVGFPFQDFYSFGIWGEKNHLGAPEPKKEILAVSVTNLQGVYLASHLGWDGLNWLKARQPSADIGHSILLYDVTQDARAHEWLAHDYLSGGMLLQARRETDRALRINPKSAWALVLSSFLSLGDGKTEEAAKFFERAAQADPHLDFPWADAIKVRPVQQLYSQGLTRVGRALLRQTKIDAAGMASQLASRIDPGYPPALEAFAQALYLKGYHNEAKQAAKQALQLDPNNVSMKKLAGF